ncbi:MAG: HD domain-containing protein [Planctomycetota bacterium]
MQTNHLIPLARRLLLLPLDDTHPDLWLWEHSERVMQLAPRIAALPDVSDRQVDPEVLAAAALFHDAGWALEVQQGRVARWQVLTRPTNDIQRELGAAMLLDEAERLLPEPIRRLAADAIRQCNDRRTTLPEARILADAEALDELGTLYVLRQFRLYQGEARPLQQIIDTWQRQREYRYWDVRLTTGFHFAPVRELARQRLRAVDAFMTTLGSDLHGDDLAQLAKAPDARAAGD